VVAVARFRAKIVNDFRFWLTLLLCAAIPLGVSGWLQSKNRRQLPPLPPLHSFDWHGTGEMTFRSLAGLKRSDARIFGAPMYWDERMDRAHRFYPMLVNNGYSYPALLQLSLFTVVLNCTNPAHRGRIDAARSRSQFAAANDAVRFGLFFSVSAMVAVAAFSLGAIKSLLEGDRPFPLVSFVWYDLAMAWYAPLVMVLPFVGDVYDGGYWMPRLTLPAIGIFFILAFAAADRLAAKMGPTPGSPILAAVCLQSVFEIRSIIF